MFRRREGGVGARLRPEVEKLMGSFFVAKHAGSMNDTGYSRRRASRKMIVSDCEPLPTPPRWTTTGGCQAASGTRAKGGAAAGGGGGEKGQEGAGQAREREEGRRAKARGRGPTWLAVRMGWRSWLT